MTDHKADSAEFERWCAETYRSQAYLHTSATSGEWEAWQAGAAAMQARCAAQPIDLPSMDTILRNAARRSATIVDRGRLVQPVEPVAWLEQVTVSSGNCSEPTKEWRATQNPSTSNAPRRPLYAADTIEAQAARIRLLREALADAIVCVQDWSAYVAPYYLEKHDLNGDVKRLRAVMEATR